MPAHTMGTYTLRCAPSDSGTIRLYEMVRVCVAYHVCMYGVLLPLLSVRARLFFFVEKT